MSEPIATYCASRRINADERIELFLLVCREVNLLHQKLRLHGQLRADSVFVDDAGHPVLADPAQPSEPGGTTAIDVTALQSLLIDILKGPEGTGRVPADAKAIAGHRYESVDQLAADIERHLDGRPVVARQGSSFYRFRKLLSRNKTIILSGAGLTCGLVLFAWGFFVSERQRYLADEQLREVRATAGLMSMSIPGRILEVPGSLELRRRMVSYGLEYVDQKNAERDPADLRQRKRIALGYFNIANALGAPGAANLADLEGAARAYRKTADLLFEDEAPLRKDREALAAMGSALANRAEVLMRLQRSQEAFQAAEECVSLAAKVRADDAELSCRTTRLRAAVEVGKPVADSEVDDLVQRASEWAGTPEGAQLQAEVRRVAARLYLKKKVFAKALEHAVAGLDITAKKDRATPMSLQRGDLLIIAARADEALGDKQKGAGRFDECFDVLRELMRRDPESVESRIALAVALVESVDFVDDDERLRQARLREAEQLVRGVMKDAKYPPAETVLAQIQAVPSRIP